MDTTFGIQILALNTEMRNQLRGHSFTFLTFLMILVSLITFPFRVPKCN